MGSKYAKRGASFGNEADDLCVNADGVVLDTYGSSTLEIQAAGDSVKKGVVMYSEGMAVPKDMPGIVSGRVHDAIYYQPVLNLNKLIKPDFAIFRVIQLAQGRIHRETAISFFNGYGNELNTFFPGRPDWYDEEMTYWGKSALIQRENSDVFTDHDWTPLIETTSDSIWVNKWRSDSKTIFTIFSLKPQGFNGALFNIGAAKDEHVIDLWNHEKVIIDTLNGKTYARAKLEAFNNFRLNSRMEGNAGCVAVFRKVLGTELKSDSITVSASGGTKIKIWAGNPSYQNKQSAEFTALNLKLKLLDLFGRYEGKIVVQLFEGTRLLDENILFLEPATPRLISKTVKTPPAEKIPDGMVEVPAGKYIYRAEHTNAIVIYEDLTKPEEKLMRKFYIDKYPVTNADFRKFIESSGYKPSDNKNYLRHWKDGVIPGGEENFPVVNVSLEDAKAYAEWAGKRLPTQLEWQYAAQAGDTVKWPWGNQFDSTKCNNSSGKANDVRLFDDGANKLGICDLVGNVWQMTSDVYELGCYYYFIIKGGSFFKPTSSWWYIEGGPQPLNKQQYLLMVEQGFERNSTVGFRCVKDAK